MFLKRIIKFRSDKAILGPSKASVPDCKPFEHLQNIMSGSTLSDLFLPDLILRVNEHWDCVRNTNFEKCCTTH